MAEAKFVKSDVLNIILSSLKEYINNADSKKANDFTLGGGLKWDNTGNKHELNIDIDNSVFEIVTEKPDATTGKKNKIYIVANGQSSGENKYTEYIWTGSAWEILGEFQADFNIDDYVESKVYNSFVTTTNGKFEELNSTVSGISKNLTSHTGNTDIHVTPEDKTNWNNKGTVKTVSGEAADGSNLSLVSNNDTENPKLTVSVATNYSIPLTSKQAEWDAKQTASQVTDAIDKKLSDAAYITSAAINNLVNSISVDGATIAYTTYGDSVGKSFTIDTVENATKLGGTAASEYVKFSNHANKTTYGVVAEGGDVTITDGIITVSKINGTAVADIASKAYVTGAIDDLNIDQYVTQTVLSNQSYVKSTDYATDKKYGVVKIGTGINVTEGTISVTPYELTIDKINEVLIGNVTAHTHNIYLTQDTAENSYAKKNEAVKTVAINASTGTITYTPISGDPITSAPVLAGTDKYGFIKSGGIVTIKDGVIEQISGVATNDSVAKLQESVNSAVKIIEFDNSSYALSYTTVNDTSYTIANLVTTAYLESKKYLTEHQDLTSYALKADVVTEVGVNTSTKKLTWKKNGVAQAELTVPYATEATTAEKLGSTTVGSTSQPIYLKAGVPAVCEEIYTKDEIDDMFEDITDTLDILSVEEAQKMFNDIFKAATA